jgi:hypothetical protein
MKIFLPFDFEVNFTNFFRRAGYAAFTDPVTNQTSYIKRLSRDFYPRFHLYIEKDKDNKVFFNLHLDQKKPSYPGSHAHNAEYDGELIISEAQKVQGLIKNQLDNQQQRKTVEEKKNFWQTLFGK